LWVNLILYALYDTLRAKEVGGSTVLSTPSRKRKPSG
jgi:hypothetical protein